MGHVALLLLSLASQPVAEPPPFEGQVELVIKYGKESGRGTLVRSRAGDLRLDMPILGGGEGPAVPMTFIVPASNDDIVVHAIHPVRMFERVDLRPLFEADARWRVQKLGEKQVAGRATTGWRLSDQTSGDVVEVWLDATLGSGKSLARVQEQMKPTHRGAWASLVAAGGRGFPLAFAWERKLGGRVEVTASKVEASEVPPRAFELPTSYKPSPIGLTMLPGIGTR